ncbi:hypothetical protein [Nitrosovibrio tenuis]|uniref:Lipoprotein n=1 Tax=Nitrosovibrio tenuis TaxID=1233 RepID=A0A1H7RN71_9PROT|nr:hypothetical protein [Nitrosovibrio tenuis]SEL61706.1 hypothetical protein SAMN05216387_11832 [Nitrosovibrio tenuis]
MYRRSVIILLAGIAFGCYGSVTVARGGGGQPDGTSPGGAGQLGNPSGMVSGHMSEQGSDNTNAQWASGATKAQNRSDVRSDHNQGRQDQGKDMGHGHGHEKHKAKGGSSGGSY